MRTMCLLLMVGGWMVTTGAFAQQAAGIPKGAVMAFNLAACPDGWTQFTPARGRTILGVGQSTPEDTKYKLGTTGGAETHTLTIEEFPPHNHGLVGAGNGSYLKQWNATNAHYAVPCPNARAGSFRTSRLPNGWSEGEAKPHNTMPPFIALLYCEKQ